MNCLVLRLEGQRQRFIIEAHHRTDKDQIKSFSAGLSLPQLGYHLRHPETGELHLIEALEMWGNFTITQTEIPLTMANLGGRIYGSAQVTIGGRPAVCVSTSDETAQVAKISLQIVDGSVPSKPPLPDGPVRFPGLLALPIPFQQG